MMNFKSSLVALFATLASSSVALACPDGDCRPSDAATYQRVLNYSCHNGSHITSSGALRVARLAAEGAINVDAFLQTYASACSYDLARTVGEGDAAGTLSASVFQRALFFRCHNGGYVNGTGATRVARLAAARAIDVEAFLTTYNTSCSYDLARQVGEGSAANTISASAFQRVLFFRCHNGRYVTDTAALRIGRLAASRAINVDTFLEAYRAGCDFDAAREVACSPTAF